MSRIMPSMADARCFTSYLASCQYDNTLQNQFKISSSVGFRSYLQNNALAVQDETRKLHVCTYPFMDPSPTGPTVVPSNYY